ncbi:hypothetical protein [Streptomyces sp. NPDC048516]|uniref:hypothetical protein n=1 Tax=Streptomyces sp. NPDC048516 TaxID=3365565 RepID=UPI003715E1CD
MPETQPPVLPGYYSADRSVLWVRCTHCRTWTGHPHPGVRAGRVIGLRCGRQHCPRRTDGYLVGVSTVPLPEAIRCWGKLA